MAVNRNTGGILLTSDHGRVTDHRIGDARRGMFDEAWASARPSRRDGTEWEAVVRSVDDGVFGRYWDATPVWGAVFLAALDDPSKPCPDWDGRVEGVREYAEDPFDERDTRAWRSGFIQDQIDLQTETLGPLPRGIRAAYEREYGAMFDRALKARRERIETTVGGMLRSPDTPDAEAAAIASMAARSGSVELRDAALDSGLLPARDVRRLAYDPEPIVASHARRILDAR